MLSIVIPVYNEEENLIPLFDRLWPALEALNRPFEILLTNDGSQDRSFSLLKDFYHQHPKHVRIIDFQGNFGQHMALIAGFEQARGDTIITLDADLQNPPEEISKLLEKMDQGYDYVGSYRLKRHDSLFRTGISKLINKIRDWITPIRMRDQGCMLRAYHKRVINQIIASKERSTFIPALAYQFSASPVEVGIKHEARFAGTSKYSLYKLIRLNFDLITGFSLIPLQFFTIFGLIISGLSGFLVLYMLGRRILLGPEAEGVFTLFAILFLLISVLITGVGLVGEYVGRIFQSVSHRPRFIIKQIIES